MSLDLNKHIAEELLNWEPNHNPHDILYWVRNDNGRKVWNKTWKPLKNVGEAIDVIESYSQITFWELASVERERFCCTAGNYNHYDSTPSRAIIGCVLKRNGSFCEFKELFKNE